MADFFNIATRDGVISNKAYANIDGLWGPYESTNEAVQTITSRQRAVGKRFGINVYQGNTVVGVKEYQWTGTGNEDYEEIMLDVNREYNPSLNTKGYKVLRNNIPLGSQFNDVNTIYEIRDNYNIINSSVISKNLPEFDNETDYNIYYSDEGINLSTIDSTNHNAVIALNGSIFVDTNHEIIGNIIFLPSSEVVYLAKKESVVSKEYTLSIEASLSGQLRTSEIQTIEGDSYALTQGISLIKGDIITLDSSNVYSIFDSEYNLIASGSAISHEMSSDDTIYIGIASGTTGIEVGFILSCERSENGVAVLNNGGSIASTSYDYSDEINVGTTLTNLISLLPTSSDISIATSPVATLTVPTNCIVLNGLGTVVLSSDSTSYTITQGTTTLRIGIIRLVHSGMYQSCIGIPEGCVLKFNGGKLKGGVVAGVNTFVEAGEQQIFDDVTLLGTWSNSDCLVEWFGAIGDGITDDRMSIQSAIDSPFNKICLLDKVYIIDSFLSSYSNNNIGLLFSKPKRFEGFKEKRDSSKYIIKVGANVLLESVIMVASKGVWLRNFHIQGYSSNLPKTERHISTPFNNAYYAENVLENIYCQWCTGTSIYFLGYLNLIKLCRTENCQVGFFIGGSHGLEVGTGISEVDCPNIRFEGNYVINSKHQAYVFNATTSSLINNCSADRCGFDASNFTEANVYPVYDFKRCRFVNVAGCANEGAAKGLSVTSSLLLAFVGCSWHIKPNTGLPDNWTKINIRYSSSIEFAECGFASNTPNFISCDNTNTESIFFNGCMAYIGVNQAYRQLGTNAFVDDNSNNIAIIEYNVNDVIKDTDVSEHGIASSFEVTSYAQLTESANPINGKYSFFPKTITNTATSSTFSLINSVFKNYKGELNFDASNKAICFYRNCAITNVDKFILKNCNELKMAMDAQGNTPSLIITNSIVDISCVGNFTNGNYVITLINSTLIINETAVNYANSSYTINCDNDSIVKVVNDRGDVWISKDGKVPYNVVSSLPSSASLGEMCFYNGKPTWWNGTEWVDATGSNVS